MSTVLEREAMDRKLEKVLRMCCDGNSEAYRYLTTIAASARVIDDLVDGDVSVDRESIYRSYFGLSCDLYQNKFFIDHFHQLTATWTVAFNAWMDSNEWEEGDETERVYSHVLRDYINELCPLVAYLIGGYNHMRKVSLEVRRLFKKEMG